MKPQARLLTLALALALGAASCSRRETVEYIRVKPVKGIIEITFEAPKSWARSLSQTGKADSSWAVELSHPENRFATIGIQKFTTDPKRTGFPVLTAEAFLERLKQLPKTTVGPEEPRKTPHLSLRSFPYEGDYIQVSGGAGKAPHMKGIDACFEAGGFLYTVSYAVPAEDFAIYLPIFEHLLETLELSPA